MKEIGGILLLLCIATAMLWLMLCATCRDKHCSSIRRKIGWFAVVFLAVNVIVFGVSSVRADDVNTTAIIETTIIPKQTRAEYILARVAEADKLCDEQKLSFITEEGKTTRTIVEKNKKGKLVKRKIVSRVNKIVARPVYLCAFKESDQTWHVVKIFVTYPVAKTYNKFPAWVSTPGYEIEHVAGRGIARLTFNLSQKGEHLTIYRYRHAWFTKNAKAHNAHEIIRTAEAVNYTPYHADFNNLELRNRGVNFLQRELNATFSELKQAHVASRAFPDKLISAVIHPKQPIILAAIEQTDDGKFHANPAGAINAIFIEYALNRGRAFNWSVSSANAIGALQFTNKNGNGTYDLVVRAYPKANLNTDFEEGTRDLRNILKAAICLLDLELAQLSEVQELYEKNPKLGGIYPVAAYNEGGGGARQLYALVLKHNINLEEEDVELPRNVFQRIKRALVPKKNKPMRTVINHETYGYIKKYMYVWKYLDTFEVHVTDAK